jgi:hypothetical protein
MKNFNNYAYEVTRKTMKKHGHDLDAKGYNLELDINVKDSQIAMVFEDVAFTIETLEEMGAFGSDNYEDCLKASIDVKAIPNGFNSRTVIHVSLGDMSTYADLKEFVAQLEDLRTSDDTLIDGHLSMAVKLDKSYAERTSCGECNYEDYCISPEPHKCYIKFRTV